jgi:hypothetical protein
MRLELNRVSVVDGQEIALRTQSKQDHIFIEAKQNERIMIEIPE